MRPRSLTIILLLAVTLAAVAGGRPTRASNAIAKAEGLTCTTCHDKPGSRLLTDRGKYYEQMRTLAGYDKVIAFAECTACHVRKPGSTKLTATGRHFAAAVGDMRGLRQWLEENHPPMLKSH